MPDENPFLRIIGVIDYIEDNIREKLTLDDISQYANLSKYHLNRLFKAITRLKLMGYVRNRKLSQSIFDLLNTNLKVIDIASEYNFDYEQSFIRSFLNLFKTTPERFRREKPIIELTEKIDQKQFYLIEKAGAVFNSRIVLKTAFKLVGFKHKVHIGEDAQHQIGNKLGVDFYLNHRHKIKHMKFENIYIGLIEINDMADGYAYYMPSAEVTAIEDIPSGMDVCVIPTNKYAVFTYIGFHSPMSISSLCLDHIKEYIFLIWLANSSYELAGNYFFESINEAVASDDYCEVNIYVPVKNR